jgi:hypothetical protein
MERQATGTADFTRVAAGGFLVKLLDCGAGGGSKSTGFEDAPATGYGTTDGVAGVLNAKIV